MATGKPHALSESAARKVAADNRRLANISLGSPPDELIIRESERNWCIFQYGDWWTQAGTEQTQIASGYSTALENGNANPGKGTLFFLDYYGAPNNARLKMHTMSAYDDAWATVLSTGWYDIGLSVYGYAHWRYGHTGGTGVTDFAVAGGTNHQHNISSNYYDTSRYRYGTLLIRFRYKESSGSWTNIDNWRWANSSDGFVMNNLRQAGTSNPYEVFYMRQPVYLKEGWKLQFDCEFTSGAPSGTVRTAFITYAWNNICTVHWLGAGPATTQKVPDIAVAQGD